MAESKEHYRLKKRNIVPYILLLAIGGMALYFLFEARQLQGELETSNAELKKFEERQMGYREWVRIDSSLIDGKFEAAVRAYNDELKNESGGDSIRLALRIAMAKQLRRYRSAYYSQKKLRDSLMAADSLEQKGQATPEEIREYDAVSFKLEKAKVQLAQVQKQLREKSFGEYLTFKSSKGNQMHYVGTVKDGMANGYGVAILDTGSRYQGQWKDNRRHGEGTFYWPDGEYYVGSYENGQRKGQGTYYWPNGEKYIGQWKADKRNGKGVFYGEDGEVMTSGTWKNDKLVEEDEKE